MTNTTTTYRDGTARYIATADGPPNMDAMPSDELMTIWNTINREPVRTARAWFPDAYRGFVAATRDLGAYASNTATAMDCRRRGDIGTAVMYETICDRIYDRLPAFARTW
jgi:hypothetical protein